MASDFTPDLSLLNVDAVAAHVIGIAAEVAKTTKTPFDDMAVQAAAPLFTQWLKNEIAAWSANPQAFAAMSTDDHLAKMAAAPQVYGKIGDGVLLGKLIELGKQIIPIIIPLIFATPTP